MFTRTLRTTLVLVAMLVGADAWAAASVSSLVLDSSVRSGRTTTDFTYRIVVNNGAPALANAAAAVTSSAAAIVVLDGAVSLGNLAANSSTTSVDTIKLRVDRTVPFDSSKLSWTVSGTPQIDVPNVVGLTQAAASAAITGAGLVVGTVTTANSSTVAAGNVISQAPAGGTSVAPGSAVNLVVSLGAAQVSVPNVVGLTQAAASAAITGAGLVVGTVGTANSSTVAAGNVISQAPAGGSSVMAGFPVDLVVSIGPANATPATLLLSLTQVVVGAGESLTVTSQVQDSGGNPIPSPPSVTYEILFDAATTVGLLPGVTGNQVITGANTRGSFDLRGTVQGTAITATVRFTVLQNNTQSQNSGHFVALSAAQGAVVRNVATLAQALANGNTAAIGPASAALTAAAASVNPNLMNLASAYAPDTGFVPNLTQVIARGYTQSASDIAFGTLTGQLRTKIQQITTLLNTPGANVATNMATLAQYVTDLTTLANAVQLAANTPGVHGVVRHSRAVNDMLTIDMPNVLLAIVSRVNAELREQGLIAMQGGPGAMYQSFESALDDESAQRFASAGSPGAMYADQRPAQFGLTGLLGAMGPIGNLIVKVYGPFIDQVQKMYIILAAQQFLNATLPPGPVVAGLITGASQSFHVYHSTSTVLEVAGNVTAAQAAASKVYLIGGAAVNESAALANTLGDVRNIRSFRDLYNFFAAVDGALQSASRSLADATQPPSSVRAESFCIVSFDSCIEYHYNTGFNYVGSGGPISLEPVMIMVRIPDPVQPGYGLGIFNFVGR